ncbi:hypothetical protein ACFQYP_12715 [Nonomuraea antimicrobica]
MAGTWTSVKELMADRYARRLAQRGYAALSFDFTGFGESGARRGTWSRRCGRCATSTTR